MEVWLNSFNYLKHLLKFRLNLHNEREKHYIIAMIRILNKIFSMSLMTLFLLAFFIAIGAATFIENDFGTPVAQKWVYQALWFEIIIGYLFFTMAYNIYRYKLFQWKKIGSLVFHFSFLVIVIGALITRVSGFEGAMFIREGGSSNQIISRTTFLQIKTHDLKQQYVYDLPLIMDGHTDNSFKHDYEFPGESEEISIEFLSLKEHVKDTIIPKGKSSGDPYIEIVTTGKVSNYIKSGELFNVGPVEIAFNNREHTDAISIFETDSGIYVQTPFELGYLQMSDQSAGVVKQDSIQRFNTKRLYSVMGQQFVFNNYYPSAQLELIEDSTIAKEIKALTVRVSQGNLSTDVLLKGGNGAVDNLVKFDLGNLHYELAYGAKLIQLPFYLYLDDFELKRYPGTVNPSSFSSKITLIDPEINLEEPHHIFMNNVLDYGGYRFFQSSYDEDEKGTVLSVNHDEMGTLVTYIGYFLLGLGFVISLMARGGRFKFLMKKAKEVREKRESLGVITLLLLSTLMLAVGKSSFSQQNESSRNNPVFDSAGVVKAIDYEHAEKYGRLIIQDQQGRFQPVHTLATNILKKVSRKSTYNGQSAMQVFLGLHTNGLAWNLEPLIYVSGAEIRKKLNLTSSRGALADFLTLDFRYILFEDAEVARRKKPAERNQYDKDVLKTDERFNILYGVFTGLYLKILPLPNDINQNWYSPFDPENPFEGEDAEFLNSIIPLYNLAIQTGHQSGDWAQADRVVELIDTFQRKVASDEIMPSKSKIEWEITYNKMDVFKWLNWFYLLIGFILLVLQFIQIFKPKMNLKWPLRVGLYLFIAMFIAHGVGLGIRWYLSGHAPWSNGYEAVVFIGFITVLAGLLFYRQSKIVLGATGILAWLMLFVAHMNALDPEITNLVPVLKSYWLMIHVAIITGSYGFLGLGAILGLICLVMNVFLNDNNKKRILLTTKELTHVSEMTLIIGLFMLTIGTFLGGVWANESWGRYWGWDAKETWALASVLVYAIILHFRFVPGLKSQFAFNVASLWGYGSIIMTFFGVNFYLSGLHSYAQGDPIPIPSWVPITLIILIILSVISGLRLKTKK